MAERYDALQRRLAGALAADRPGSHGPRVLVALPSYSLDRSVLAHYGERVAPLENRFLYVALRTADLATRVVYLSSRPVDPGIFEAYLSLAPAADHEAIRSRTLLLSPDDLSVGPLAAKVLARPDLVAEIRRFIGDDPALIEPWNVTDAERDLALALDVPLNGTRPELWRLATKSEGRRLFRTTGVACPPGVEDVTSTEGVVAAIRQLRSTGAAQAGVVVKLDDSVAGDGNVVLVAPDLEADVESAVRGALPAWYVDRLRDGGVVEELVVGEEFRSPSGQGEIHPDGDVRVLATHDQRLGGESGQVFEGCSFPASDDYASEVAHGVDVVGRALQERGAIGRYAVDFAAARTGSSWRLAALEINLRKGGTTHPFGVTRLLTAGRYDPPSNRFALPDGSSRFYGATDNLVDPGWIGRPPAEVVERLRDAGVAYDRAAATGIVPHLLDCLAVDGRMGYTAIGVDRAHVAELEERLRLALA
ncbi:MAG TPA: peptide ligase PGM1-related protein [Acidimicrobiales bacterium]|nr:peptide ligase PGM1-related protein [Acidimicrobiales bacterium]